MSHAHRARTVEVVVVDLSEIDLSTAHATMTAAVRSTGQHLAQVPVDRTRHLRATVAAVLDEALGSARLFRTGRWLPVAFYNPATARIALGPIPTGCVLWAGGPIALPPEGAVGQWCERTGELSVGAKVAVVEQPDEQHLSRATDRHEAWHHQRL